MSITPRDREWKTEYVPHLEPQQAYDRLNHIREPIFRKFAVEIFLYFYNDFQPHNQTLGIRWEHVNSREPTLIVADIKFPMDFPNDSQFMYPILTGIRCTNRTIALNGTTATLAMTFENNNIPAIEVSKTPQRRAPSPIHTRDLSPRRSHSIPSTFVIDSPPPLPEYRSKSRSHVSDTSHKSPGKFRRSESIRRQLRNPLSGEHDSRSSSGSYEYVEEVSDKEEAYDNHKKEEKKGFFRNLF